jgi:hypothetical protein
VMEVRAVCRDLLEALDRLEIHPTDSRSREVRGGIRYQ